MKNKSVSLVILIIVLLIPMLIFAGDDENSFNNALAEKLVNQCANIQKNDIVFINGGLKNAELLEDLSIQIRKLGAFSIRTFGSDRVNRKYYDEVPAKFDSQTPELALKIATMIDAAIYVSFNENQSMFADVPPKRFTDQAAAFTPINSIYLSRGIKQVSLGNGLYPTEDRAKRFNISLEKLSKLFWDGVNVDYTELEKIGQKIKAKLASGKELVLTNPNGTNFKVNIESRDIFISDGIISDADVKTGKAACQVWLPAGEVYLAPVLGTAEGKIVVDKQFYLGKLIKNVTLKFKEGKLISMKAKSGLKPLKDLYNASGEGKDIFSVIDIGINPNVNIPSNSDMVAWMANGMITVGVGGNTWAGGDNESNFFMANYLPGSTLKIDGKILIENGVLKP